MAQRILLDRDYIPFGLAVASSQDTIGVPVFKYGTNAAVGTSAETIWLQGGAYTWPAAAATLEVTSTDNTADAAAGTGALTVTIEGLDASYDAISETVTMTGQTAAATTASFLRVQRVYVATAGSGLTNAGIIYVANSSGTHTTGTPTDLTLVYATIGAGEGQSLQAFYTVPNNFTAYVSNVTAGSQDGTDATTITFRSRLLGAAWLTQEKFVVFKGTTTRQHEVPLVFAEKTDLELLGTAAANTPDVEGSFDVLLLPD